MRTLLCAAVALVLPLAGCGGGDDGTARDWLRSVCGDDAVIAEPPADRDYSDYDAEGTLTCTTPEHSPDDYSYVDAVAFTTTTDPEDALLSSVDGYESGDGVEVRYATRRIESGWAVVMAVAPTQAIRDGFDELEDFDAYGSAEVFDRTYDTYE